MAQAATPWHLTDDYVKLTRRDIPPGGRSTYVVPHPVGPTPTDLTTFVYGQAEVTIDNWPNIMYMLEPTEPWKAFKASRKPPQKRDHNGQLMWEKWPRVGERPRPILDYAVLPDNISTAEDWYWFHLWRRIDPRVTWPDITMRMEVHQRTAQSDSKIHNRISNMSRRVWGKHYYILSWFNKQAIDKTHVYNALRDANIPLHLNTTRGITPGLVDPDQPDGQRIPRPVLNSRMGIPRGPNTNMQRRRRNAAHDPPSEHEKDDVDLVDEDRANEIEDEDEDDSSEDEDEEHEVREDDGGEQDPYPTQRRRRMPTEEATAAGQLHSGFIDDPLNEYLGDDIDNDIDEDLARYSVARDPDIQRLRGQINNIRQNPPRR